VVIPELRRAEAHLQLFDSLENLTRAVNDVFGQITSRIQDEKKRLDSLKGRIDLADAKVKKMKGSTRAQTVLSPAKYPAPEVLPQYQSLLSSSLSYGDASQIPRHGRYHLNSTEYSYAEPPTHTAQQTLKEHSGKTFVRRLEKSVFGDASVSIPGVRAAPLNVLGVGPVPSVKSVSNLLLFNTEFNPYRSAFQSYDPLEGQEKPKQVVEEKRDLLGAQPATILEGDQMPMATLVKISYVPDLGEVPVFELPDQLDLPGVADLGGADRTSWASGIAPSLASALLDLPDVTPGASVTSGGAAPPPSTTTAPPPAPPPPAAAGGPPPPPPPPPPSSTPPVASSRPSTRDNIPPPDSTGDPRQDLLASIRAGKALKSSGEGGENEEDGSSRRRRRGKAPPPPVPKGNTMMDMFGDLLTALDRRRKGMMAQNDIRRDEPAAPSAPSAVPSLEGDSIASAPPTESKLRLLLPDNIDPDTEEDEAADAAWLDQ
jgi:hypothetical protein